VANQGDISDAAMAPVSAAATQAKTTTRQMAQLFNIDKDGHIEAITQKLLEDPIPSGIGKPDPGIINAKAGKDLCPPITALMAKFPFSPNSKVEATFQDVNSVFKPKEGAIWTFYDANLQKLLQKQGSKFAAVSSSGVTITPAFLDMMNHAAAFTDAAYPAGAADPHFAYTVKPIFTAEQDSITLHIDGQTATFTAANPSKAFTWPGSAQGADMSVKYKDGASNEYGSYPGLWAVFRFVQDADAHKGSVIEMKLRSGKSGALVSHNGQPVTVSLDIAANPPVFDAGYLGGMKCVAQVAK
jgi:type VI protein secretion system component VasK